jgi:hypothetical protein
MTARDPSETLGESALRRGRGPVYIAAMGRKLNQDEKRALQAAEVAKFVQQYGRKSQKGVEPIDRQYDRRTEAKIKRLPPEDLDRLIREDEGITDKNGQPPP